jgi:DNA anti-recombination protein RmuC
MRARLVVLLVAILVVAGFAALNWSEFLRPVPLSFGLTVSEAPLGLIMLVLLGITLLAFLVSSAYQQTQNLIESRHHAKALSAQRDLAEKAEASRFTDLRQHIDSQLREMRQHEVIAASEFEKAMVQAQRELRTQLEQMNRTLSARLGEFEAHLNARVDPTVRATPVEIR